MTAILLGAAILILCAAALGFLFAGDDEPRWFWSLWAGWATFCLLCAVGIVVLALHFAARYW